MCVVDNYWSWGVMITLPTFMLHTFIRMNSSHSQLDPDPCFSCNINTSSRLFNLAQDTEKSDYTNSKAEPIYSSIFGRQFLKLLVQNILSAFCQLFLL